MLEEQLKTRMFLNKAGAFSIKKGTKEIYDTFEYCANLFNNPDNLLVMYPQGGFQSVHSFPVTFNRGVIKITEKIDQDFQLIFLAVLTDFFAHKKPSVNFFLQEYNLKYKHSIEQLEQAYNDFLKESILAQNENIFN